MKYLLTILALILITSSGFGQAINLDPPDTITSGTGQVIDLDAVYASADAFPGPSSFTIDSISGGLRLTWTPDAEYETEVYLSIASAAYNLISTVAPTIGTYDYLDTATVELLSFKLRWKDDNTVLAAPASLTVTAIAFGDSMIFTKGDTLAESYEWMYKSGKNGVYSLLTTTTTDTIYKHVAIRSDTVYYKVRAKEGTLPVYSAYSNEVSNPFRFVGTDTNTIAWYIASDLTTITKDGSNLVSRWNDKLASGRDLIQATGSKQPLWAGDSITFDGTSDFIKTATFAGTNYVQPIFIYGVFKQATWTNSDRFFDGGTSTTISVFQTTTTPNISAAGGAPIITFTLDTWGIFRLLYNGNSSKFMLNAFEEPNDHAFGTAALRAFTLGSYSGGDAFWGNIKVREIIIRKVVDSAANEALIYNYLKQKYNL